MKRIFTSFFLSILVAICLTILVEPIHGQYPIFFTISGVVFNDIDSDGMRDVGEPGISGVTVSRGGATSVTNASGNYVFASLTAGLYTISRVLPAGYVGTSANPVVTTVGPDRVINFGIRPSAGPVLFTISGVVFNDIDSDGIRDVGEPGISGVTVSRGAVTDVSDFSGNYSFTLLSAGTYTVSRVLPAGYVGTSANPVVTTVGPDRLINFGIRLVPTYQVTVNVKDISLSGPGTCSPGLLTNVSGITVNILGHLSQTTGGTGQVVFSNVTQSPPNAAITILGFASGYSLKEYIVTGVPPPTPLSSSPVSVPISANTEVTFCIGLDNSEWFQTDLGDVRFSELENPLPPLSPPYASSDLNFPGVYFSSDPYVDLGLGGEPAISAKGWLVNEEYEYNSKSEGRNGAMSYSFYKSKAGKDGVNIIDVPAADLNNGQVTGSGVYEHTGLGILTIGSSYIHDPGGVSSGRRVVVLVEGDVVIDDDIPVLPGGVFIVAAKGDITIESGVEDIQGIYSSEGSIIIEGINDCTAIPAVPDEALDVGGALIANSKKPFASGDSGAVELERSLCAGNSTNPALVVETRADFLIQLTDFYKTSYSKWEEEKP